VLLCLSCEHNADSYNSCIAVPILHVFELKTTSMQILERAGVQLSQQDLQRLASRFDVHDDGFISIQLFTHFLDGSTATTAAIASDNDKYSSSKASRNQSRHSSSRKHNSSEHNESEGMKFNHLNYIDLKFDKILFCSCFISVSGNCFVLIGVLVLE
jgi:hypothetical protein